VKAGDKQNILGLYRKQGNGRVEIPASFLLDLFFDPEDGDPMFLLNVG
jgi:hypothetical protein